MHTPTHTISTRTPFPGEVSILTPKALLNRALQRYRRLIQRLQGVRNRSRKEPHQMGNERWDMEHEKLQKPPIGGAMELSIAHRETPTRILLYTFML
jgi:hypothetical protein